MDSLYDIYQQIRYYLNPETIAAAGYVVILFVVFAETGLAAGFFLPGDSLLFVAGLFAADGKFNLFALLIGVFLAAVIGDAVGYFTGSKMGPRLFKRQKSLLFRPSHLQKAQAFYEKYGGKTIIIARFVPIVRTFAPIVAGAAQMPYRQFVIYNVIGGFLWVFTMILGGFFLGRAFPALREHIEIVVIVIVALSLMPPVIEYLKSRREKARAAQSGNA
ncbi:MAG TPA: VTT domain-containing protein [Pyrinomonadaceae bacterium]|jgi:membrane-associated protein|nr:VTT domain-containing protein [Pyrinomonadaceae bacterium]